MFAPQGAYDSATADKYDRFVLGLNDQGYLLASSIKDISMSLTKILGHQFSLKPLDDRAAVRKAIEEII